MSTPSRRLQSHSHGFGLVLGLLLVAPTLGFGQERQNPYGEWRYQSGDAWGTRFSPVDQIDASNFADLEVAWEWRADNFGPVVDQQFKSHANVHRRAPVHRGRPAPDSSRDQPNDR